MLAFTRLLSASPFSTLGIYLLACLIMSAAEAVYVLFGFGVGLIAVGSLAALLEQVQDVVVMLLLLNLPPEIWVTARGFRTICWREVMWICLGIAVGVPLGTLALGWIEEASGLRLLGLLLLLLGIVFLFLPGHARIRWPGWAAPLAGSIGGVLGAMFGTGGPPLILYYRLAGVDKAAFRQSLLAVFLVISLVRLPAYGIAGLITARRALGAALLLPSVLLGALVGNRVHLQMKEETFWRLMALVLELLGVLLLLRL